MRWMGVVCGGVCGCMLCVVCVRNVWGLVRVCYCMLLCVCAMLCACVAMLCAHLLYVSKWKSLGVSSQKKKPVGWPMVNMLA